MATVTNFANAWESTLTADMLGTDLTAQVQTTNGAPASPCYLVIEPHNPDKREYALFDGAFTANSFATTTLANRYLDGSAAASGITHAAGAIVRFAPVAQHFRNIQNSAVWLDEAQTISGAKTFSVDPTLADGSSALSQKEGNAAYRARVGGGFHDVTAAPYNAVGDGVADDTAAIQAALDDAMNLPGGGGKGYVFLPAGTYKVTALSISTGQVHFVGAGRLVTILKHVGTGACLSITTSGQHRIAGLTFDGAGATVDPNLLKIGDGSSHNTIERVGFDNQPVGVAVMLEGALDNNFWDCRFASNTRHLRLAATATYPSNQNTFLGCKFEGATEAAGTAVLVENSEGNSFLYCLVQGNNTIYALRLLASATTSWPCRGTKITGCWFESNGNAQVGSRGIWVSGGNAGAQAIVGTVIRDNLLLSSVQDDPSEQIYLEQAADTFISHNYANLGSPNYSVRIGTGVVKTRTTDNSLAGVDETPARSYESALATDFSNGTATTYTAYHSGSFTPQSKTGIAQVDISGVATGSQVSLRAVVGGVAYNLGNVPAGSAQATGRRIRLTGLTPGTAVSWSVQYRADTGGGWYVRPATQNELTVFSYEDAP